VTAIDPAGFRRLLGHFATGVTVVTAADPAGRPAGMTVSSLASVSLEPPLLLICIDRAADAHAALTGAPRFVVNVLTEEQEALARRFAESGADRVSGIRWQAEDGVPALDGVLARIACERASVHVEGDHSVIVGRVTGGSHGDGAPLLYYRGRYAELGPR
jgi:3-hydroxy-9,10-secoandrosta-1,3,5(10)-triene-9,17-dione monooxygenase reductase component